MAELDRLVTECMDNSSDLIEGTNSDDNMPVAIGGGDITVDGLAGFDIIVLSDKGDTAYLSDGPHNFILGDDTFVTPKNIEGIWGGGGNDLLIGNDSLNYGDSNSKGSLLNGQSGNDTIFGSFGTDTLKGGDGKDVLRLQIDGHGKYSTYTVMEDDFKGRSLGLGNDYISGFEEVHGGKGNDVFIGAVMHEDWFPGDFYIDNMGFLGEGNDQEIFVEYFMFNTHSFSGGEGDDTMVMGYSGRDRTKRTEFSSTTNWNWVDKFDGGEGVDTLATRTNRDDVIDMTGSLLSNAHLKDVEIIKTGDGDDKVILEGRSRNEMTVYGGSGDDTIVGTKNGDWLVGNTGEDHFYSDADTRQILYGAVNEDQRDERDYFHLAADSYDKSNKVDLVVGFELNRDLIVTPFRHETDGGVGAPTKYAVKNWDGDTYVRLWENNTFQDVLKLGGIEGSEGFCNWFDGSGVTQEWTAVYTYNAFTGQREVYWGFRVQNVDDC